VNLDNLVTVRVKVPLPLCWGNSITPTVENGRQSVKRGKKAITRSFNGNPVEHVSMDSVSEDVAELS
jgi:hypothetical protein